MAAANPASSRGSSFGHTAGDGGGWLPHATKKRTEMNLIMAVSLILALAVAAVSMMALLIARSLERADSRAGTADDRAAAASQANNALIAAVVSASTVASSSAAGCASSSTVSCS